MSKLIDLTGKTLGSIFVLNRVIKKIQKKNGNYSSQTAWDCKCLTCNNKFEKTSRALKHYFAPICPFCPPRVGSLKWKGSRFEKNINGFAVRKIFNEIDCAKINAEFDITKVQ